MNTQNLIDTARALVASDRGLLALWNRAFGGCASSRPQYSTGLARCGEVTEKVLRTVFNQLASQRVMLEGLILKPNMVLPGLTCPHQETVEEVADATIRCLWRTVPAAVPGVAFLSGGQSAELASARLNAINVQ